MDHKRKRGEEMKPRVYEIMLDTDVWGTVAAAQTEFMATVFAEAEKSGLVGHGLNITMTQKGDR